MSRVVECSNIFAVSCYRADATNTNGRAFYSNASCYRADARNTIWRGSYHAWSQKYSSIATMWLCRWTRCCYRAHWHGMVVYNWWCDVDFHFRTLCKLLCCNVDGWNMQTYLYYLDEEATAISIRSVDECAHQINNNSRVLRTLHVDEDHCWLQSACVMCRWCE